MKTQLFSPYIVGQMQLRNRISVPPMCQYQAIDGKATTWHKVHYGKLAGSGAGLVCIEATAVTPDGLYNRFRFGTLVRRIGGIFCRNCSDNESD